MIQVQEFAHKGNKIKHFVLSNNNGVCAKITNYGAILTSLTLPLKTGDREIVLGFDSLEEYQSENYLRDYPYFGAIIGRYANRINQGKITIDGKDVQLPTNHGQHHLHGGYSGFDKRTWDAEIVDESRLQLSLLSIDGDEDFPGNMKITVIYELNDENELAIYYSATCDKTSPINLTSHSYFNFTGGEKNILNHELQIDSDQILENNTELIPTGSYIDVENTAFDFRAQKKISKDIDSVENYDNCFVLKTEGKTLRKVAEVYEEKSNISMEVSTDFPGLQLYTGMFINVKGNNKFGPFSGLALETQGYPDAPNQENFSHGLIHPGEVYKYQTRYKLHF